jgi:hypothetical protein
MVNVIGNLYGRRLSYPMQCEAMLGGYIWIVSAVGFVAGLLLWPRLRSREVSSLSYFRYRGRGVGNLLFEMGSVL